MTYYTLKILKSLMKTSYNLVLKHYVQEPTHETLPLKRPQGRKPDGQGESGFQGFQKGQLTRSHPWQGHEESAWQARQIRFSGISKSWNPCFHVKDDICLSDACLNGLWHRQEAFPNLFPNKNQFRTLINKFPRW